MQTNLLNKSFTTSMKGVAILMVIISHAGYDGFRLKFLIPLGAIGVAIFLILSGYGLMESYYKNGLSNFWSKRFIRVLLPYLAWIGLYVSFMLLLKKDFTIHSLRYWFVEYIIIWYIVFYFTLKYANKHKWPVFFAVAILLFLIKSNLQAQQSLSFMVGIAISEWKGYIAKIERKKLFIIGCTFLLIAIVSFSMKHLLFIENFNNINDALVIRNISEDDYGTKFLQLIPKVPFAISLIILFSFLRIESSRLLFAIGLASYELYLVHSPFRDTIDGDVCNLFIFIITISYLGYMLYTFNKK